jgi:hypothetical protein
MLVGRVSSIPLCSPGRLVRFGPEGVSPLISILAATSDPDGKVDDRAFPSRWAHSIGVLENRSWGTFLIEAGTCLL